MLQEIEQRRDKILSQNLFSINIRTFNALLEDIDTLISEVVRLRKGIAVANEYSFIIYCKEHDNWRIPGYIFGCGGEDHDNG